MDKVRKYSKWEYEEEEEEEQDDNITPDPNQDEDPNKPKDDYSDDAPIKVKIDGQIVEMTAKELAEGYMRQSDYTRKSQEVSEMRKQIQNASPTEKKEVTEKAQEIIDNPGNFSKEDVDTARTLLQIVKGTGLAKEFGLMTKEEFELEKQKEKQVAEFGNKIDSAKTEVVKMKGMPAFNEEEIIDFMQESGIHDPLAAYLRKHDAQYRDFIIKQAKGDTSYKSDKGGKKIEPNEKPLNVRTEEGHRSFLADEIAKLKS
jgi:hypothetical protein